METTLSYDRREPVRPALEAPCRNRRLRSRSLRVSQVVWVVSTGLLGGIGIAYFAPGLPTSEGSWERPAGQATGGYRGTNATESSGEASGTSELAAARVPEGLPLQTQAAPSAVETLWHGEPLVSMAGPGARALDWGGWRMSRGTRQGEGPEAFMAYKQRLVRLALTPEHAAADFVLVEYATFGPPAKVTAYLDGKPVAYLQSPGRGTFTTAAVPLQRTRDKVGLRDVEEDVQPTELALRAAGNAGAVGGMQRTLGLRRLYFTSDAEKAMSKAPSDALPALTDAAEWPIGQGAALRLRFSALAGPKWLVVKTEAKRPLTLTVTRLEPSSLAEPTATNKAAAPLATMTVPAGSATVSAPIPAAWRSGMLLVSALDGADPDRTRPVGVSSASAVIKAAGVHTQREVPPQAGDALAKGFNVVLLLIDTLRHDRLHHHHARLATPNVDALAQRSWRFESLQAADNWTKSSCATVLSGLYPPEHGAIDGEAILPRTVVTLPEGLATAGYESAAFIANGYVSKRFGFGRGFDTWRNYIREGRLTHAEYVFGDASTWLKSRSDKTKPFFLYIQTIDPHQPYIVPRSILANYADPQYRGPVDFIRDRQLLESFKSGKVRFNDADRQHLEALYDGEVAYHDVHLAQLLETLETLGVRDNTVVIVTSDHGEELFDHESVGHGHTLYQELISVPLLVAIPGVTDDGATFRSVVGHGQIAPSIYRWLGVAPPADLESRPSLAEGSGYAVTHFLNGGVAVRAEHLKLIQGSLNNTTLYDLAEDPVERAPLRLARARGSVAAASAGNSASDLASRLPLMWQLAGSYLDVANGHSPAEAQKAGPARAAPRAQALPSGKALRPGSSVKPRRRHKAERKALDPTTRKQLEALGYIGTSAK